MQRDYALGIMLLALIAAISYSRYQILNYYRAELHRVCQTGSLFTLKGYEGHYSCYNADIEGPKW